MNGHLYTDPVTGMPTFHPPYYHLFLSLFVRLGIGIDFLLIAVSIMNVALLMLFGYLLLRRLFDSTIALLTILLLPFISQYMGPSYLFLASSFSFSVPIFLAGLWIYTKKDPTILQNILTAVLWGCAFLVSPGYLFLIAFTLAYELLFKRRYGRFALLTVVFLIVITPFFYQAYVIRRFGLLETSVFSFWHGFPNFAWLKSLIVDLLSPRDGNLIHWHMIPLLAIVGMGLAGIWRLRPMHKIPAIAGLAYLFTYYHFNTQYASRILIFFSLFLMAYAISFLLSFKSKRKPVLVIMSILVLLGLGNHVMSTFQFYNKRLNRYTMYSQQVESIKAGLGPHVKPGDFVLADAKTYRRYIMPNILVHGLLAYKSGEYYQLNSTLAKDMLRDYIVLIQCKDRDEIEYICNKYNMKIAVLSRTDPKKAIFRDLPQWWEVVYEDKLFVIFRRPDEKSSTNARRL